MQQLIWFRNDLRISDNSALHAALKAGPTVAVFYSALGNGWHMMLLPAKLILFYAT